MGGLGRWDVMVRAGHPQGSHVGSPWNLGPVEHLATHHTREGRTRLTVTSEPRDDERSILAIGPRGKLGR